MKYHVLGRRVLVKVKKFNKEEIKKELEFVEGSSIIFAPDVKDLDDERRNKTVTQTLGEVIQLGEGAWKNDDGTNLHGAGIPVKIGDHVRFQRYGAFRLNPDCEDNGEPNEYWVVEDKDLLAIER